MSMQPQNSAIYNSLARIIGYHDYRITLTEAGESIACRVLERHDLLCHMLMRLGVSEETARADACKMEHDLSDETFDAIRRHLTMYQ